jgi:DNA mismatch repair protein MutL
MDRPDFPRLTYIGQVLDSYLVAAAIQALVLVDQHAAHERVLFDRLLPRLRSENPDSQLLLIPRIVELEPAQLTSFQERCQWLSSLGFAGDVFGLHAVRIRAVPAGLRESDLDAVLARLLDRIDTGLPADDRQRQAAALLACHSAVRFGDPMSSQSAAALLASLSATHEPLSCPHGRPTRLILRDSELRRLFKRP